jgi:glucosyl-dolichyl phosphate glucuronosyltransferase
MIHLSVIIPTRNRSVLLDKTLKSISDQTFSADRFEVIIVDNGSTDETSAIANRYRGTLKNLKYFYEANPGLHVGRHCGLRESQGSILTYADDDIEAFPTWIEGIYESFLQEDVGIVGGKDVPLYEAPPPDWLNDLWEINSYGKFMSYFSLLDFGDEVMEIDPDFVFGCNFSIRKSLLTQIGGFHPDGVPDSQLKYRGDGETHVGRQVSKLGYKTMYNPKASVNHWVPKSRMNLSYIKKRAFMSGISQSYTNSRMELIELKELKRTSTFKKALRKLKQLLLRQSLKSEILKSYYEGYEFHQNELRKDKELISWVTKPNYL